MPALERPQATWYHWARRLFPVPALGLTLRLSGKTSNSNTVTSCSLHHGLPASPSPNSASDVVSATAFASAPRAHQPCSQQTGPHPGEHGTLPPVATALWCSLPRGQRSPPPQPHDQPLSATSPPAAAGQPGCLLPLSYFSSGRLSHMGCPFRRLCCP